MTTSLTPRGGVGRAIDSCPSSDVPLGPSRADRRSSRGQEWPLNGPRFRIRTLLILVATAGLFCGSIAAAPRIKKLQDGLWAIPTFLVIYAVYIIVVGASAYLTGHLDE
jgi:hypothetical protein